MLEFKCKKCHKLLAKIFPKTIKFENDIAVHDNPYGCSIEIKCNKCKGLNILTKEQVACVV